MTVKFPFPIITVKLFCHLQNLLKDWFCKTSFQSIVYNWLNIFKKRNFWSHFTEIESSVKLNLKSNKLFIFFKEILSPWIWFQRFIIGCTLNLYDNFLWLDFILLEFRFKEIHTCLLWMNRKRRQKFIFYLRRSFFLWNVNVVANWSLNMIFSRRRCFRL